MIPENFRMLLDDLETRVATLESLEDRMLALEGRISQPTVPQPTKCHHDGEIERHWTDPNE